METFLLLIKISIINELLSLQLILFCSLHNTQCLCNVERRVKLLHNTQQLLSFILHRQQHKLFLKMLFSKKISFLSIKPHCKKFNISSLVSIISKLSYVGHVAHPNCVELPSYDAYIPYVSIPMFFVFCTKKKQ